MNDGAEKECENCQKLRDQFEEKIAALEEKVKEQSDQIDKLIKLVEKTQRSGKRQAAPFRKKNKKNPEKPGRKPGDGYGTQAFRKAPSPEEITELIHVQLPTSCPCCGGTDIQPTKTDHQYQIEIPTQPIIRQFDIEVGSCEACGKSVRGRHELQTSEATGAARSQLGARLHAMIAVLNKKLGLSHGKIQSLLSDFFNISICRSQSCRSIFRTSRRVEHNVESIQRSVRGSPQVVADETGWRVNGENSWLHVFVGTRATLYKIAKGRDASVASSVIGENYKGVLVHDGWSVYDQLVQCEHQTCLAHLIRRCNDLIEQRSESQLAAHPLPIRIRELLGDALVLETRRDELTRRGFLRQVDQLWKRLDELVLPAYQLDTDEKLAKHLSKHCDQLFTFLTETNYQIDATNWRAEQAIRPAVVNRKVWGGNRTWLGAKVQSTLMSIIQTAAQRGTEIFKFLQDALCSTRPVQLLGR